MSKKKKKKNKRYEVPECAFCFDKPARTTRTGRPCCKRCVRMPAVLASAALEEAARIRGAEMRWRVEERR
jgi:hypothetical protein